MMTAGTVVPSTAIGYLNQALSIYQSSSILTVGQVNVLPLAPVCNDNVTANIQAGQLNGTSYSAAGTNAITLSPLSGTPTPTAYANYTTAVFSAPATSTGPVTLQVGTLGYLPAYINGVQATTGQIQAGEAVIAVYNSALNGGAGGFSLIPSTAVLGLSAGTDTGSANAYVVAANPVSSALTQNQMVIFQAVNANTGASTINVNSLGAKAIDNMSGGALLAGQIAAGQQCVLIYTGTAWQLINPNLTNQTVTTLTAANIVSPIMQGAVMSGAFRNLYGVQGSSGTTNSGWTADAVLLEDGSANVVRVSNLSATLSLAAAGAVNQLDTGAVAANQWYYVWAISNGTIGGVLASLSNTAPTLPSGYIYKALIGAVRTDGSSHVYQFIQKGRQFEFATTTGFSVSAGTTAIQGGGTGGSNQLFLPYAIACRVRGTLYGNASGGIAQVGPSSTQLMVQTDNASGGAIYLPFDFELWSTSIYYNLTGGGGACYVYGMELNL